MCEITVYIKEANQIKDVVKDVWKLKVVENGILCYDSLGEETLLENTEIVEANFVHPHELIVRKRVDNK